MATPTHNREDRFWAKVAKAGPKDCWEWQGAIFYGRDHGYGKLLWFGEGEKRVWRRAHRTAFELTFGDIPRSDLLVCHSCDNKLCCNPAHLWLGTKAANNADKKAKGRTNPRDGALNSNAKLTESDVRQIHKYLKAGMSQQEIADKFGVKQPQISRIKSGATWGKT